MKFFLIILLFSPLCLILLWFASPDFFSFFCLRFSVVASVVSTSSTTASGSAGNFGFSYSLIGNCFVCYFCVSGSADFSLHQQSPSALDSFDYSHCFGSYGSSTAPSAPVSFFLPPLLRLVVLGLAAVFSARQILIIINQFNNTHICIVSLPVTKFDDTSISTRTFADFGCHIPE